MLVSRWTLISSLCAVGVIGAACDDDPAPTTDADLDGDADSDADSDADGGPPGIDDPLFANYTATVAEWITPDGYACDRGESACGGLPCPADDLWVAINSTDFRESATCSACMLVEGPLGTVTVEVIENCAGACVDGEIELSRTAFEAIGVLDEGHADVRWKLVPCARSGPIAFAYEADSDEWWAGIQVRNPALLVTGLSIRVSDEAGWEPLERDGWDHFSISADLSGGSFDFTVTAIDGQVLVEEDIAYVPGGVVDGTGQFELPAGAP